MEGKNMAVDEKTVDKALEICNKILNGTASIINNFETNCSTINKQWNDAQFERVKKSMNDSLKALRTSRLDIIAIENKLKDIKKYITEYNKIGH